MGYQFGDGIYEEVGIYSGKPVLLDEHITRLFESSKKIDLEISYDFQNIKEQLLNLIDLNKINEGIIYFQFTRGVALKDHVFSNHDMKPNFVAYMESVDIPTVQQENGVNTILSNDIRWDRCDIKFLNLLPNILAKQKAAEKGAFEAILHKENIVTEGSSTNLFMVKDENLYTPS